MKNSKKIYQKNPIITELAIDSHFHLDQLDSKSETLKNLEYNGIKKAVTIAGDTKTLSEVSEICSGCNNLFYLAGVHPYYLEDLTDEFIEEIKHKRKTDKKLVGIGEIGLDYKYVTTEQEKEFQRQKFIEQLLLADELSLPVSIHVRDVYGEAIEILKKYKQNLRHGGIIHCSMANEDETKELLSLGFYISFSGVVTFVDLDESIKIVPIEKLLIETDAPYLCPKPYRGTKNEPKYVLVTAEYIAKVKGVDVNELIKQTTQNAQNLLKI